MRGSKAIKILYWACIVACYVPLCYLSNGNPVALMFAMALSVISYTFGCRDTMEIWEKPDNSRRSSIIAGLVAIILTCFAIDADACNRCHIKACGGCYVAQAAEGLYPAIVFRDDGTYWNLAGDVQYDRVRVSYGGKVSWRFVARGNAAAQQYIPAAAQGSTVTGYSTKTETYGQQQPSVGVFAQAYRPDSNLALNLLGRNAEGNLALLKEINGGLRDQADNSVRLAQIEAVGKGYVAAVSALQNGPSSVTTKTEWRATSTPDGGLTIQPVTAENGNGGGQVNAFGSLDGYAVAEQKCGACHSGPKAKGGLDLSADLSQLLTKDRLSRLVNDEPGRPRMPVDQEGKAGHALNDKEMAALVAAAVGAGGPRPSN
jgi:hypothetical protein